MTPIAITCRQMARDVELLQDRLNELGFQARCPDVVQELVGDELVDALEGVVGVVAGDDRFTDDVLSRLPDLRAISKWGIGIDGIDLDAARARGIPVTNTPGMFDAEVADVAMAYVTMLVRGLCRIDRGVRAGGWPKPMGRSLSALTLGIIGLGGIGRALARRAQAAGMRVIGTDPASDSRRAANESGVEILDLTDVLQQANAISLHCPLTPQTHHLLDADAMAHIRPGTYLVNTSRGPVVDQNALLNALAAGTIAGAALDVFEVEPLSSDDPLVTRNDVILGSHNASNAWEACQRTHYAALDNLAVALVSGGA